MDTLWQKSVQDVDKGVVKEQAATLVRGQEGELKLVNPVEGTGSGATPNRDIAENEDLVGTFHTHPYEEGYTSVAFSGRDIAYAINHHDAITVVQSGEDVFALMPTEETPPSVDAGQLEQESKAIWMAHMDRGTPFPEAIYQANLELCARYGLAFYRGQQGVLREVYRP